MNRKTLHSPLSALNRIPHWLWITGLYLLAHIPFLLALPIFADEAIYIHWSQLVIDNAGRYGFFSMSDGKPPLFMWILSLALRLGSDPLFLARCTSMLIGLVTVFAIGKTAKLLTGKNNVARFSELFTLFAPFWWFYHRMALMDGLLTLFITLSFYFSLRIAVRCQRESAIAYDTIPFVLLLGLSFGGALITKTPALFAIPIIAMTPLFATVRQKISRRSVRDRLMESVLLIGMGGGIGCAFFLLLRVSPFFGTLFARSSDFTFSIKEVLSGEWKYVLFSSLPREMSWIAHYMTYGLSLFALAGLFFKQTRKMTLFLFASVFFFAAPLIAFGRVLYPRYFLPIAPFLTIAGAIGLEQLLRRKPLRIIGVVLLVIFAAGCLQFIVPSLTQIENIPFTTIDRMQYLEEWSAGFGNNEVRDYIRNRYSQVGNSKRIIVLTEGSFGTLPDGLSIYFFGNTQLDGVEIHGIGVGPSQIPEEYTKNLENSEVYYVVNSHRFRIADPTKLKEIFTVPRPNNAPALVFYQVIKN